MPEPLNHPGNQAMQSGTLGLLARAYYRFKPLIPRNLSWALRRVRLPGLLKRSEGIWPIDESAGQPPPGWPGWPGGKKFAFVLTHDVESQQGLENIRQLVELEHQHGLCSSFNFIPEGPYKTPATLRGWLAENGCEVGVHDLYHDGHLYESRESFNRKAESINRYLSDWGAAGFRSGFMLRQLEWLHELDIVYDASTFDTDPFEPQPDGSHTIFPFHVEPPAGRGGAGYVELPYTLPQDSTLFILMRERNANIWKRKLDWVARHGGLALVNIHPDYINFSGEKRMSDCDYPVEIIQEFFGYLGEKYQGQFWNPLARDLASWFRDQAVETKRCAADSAGGRQPIPLKK